MYIQVRPTTLFILESDDFIFTVRRTNNSTKIVVLKCREKRGKPVSLLCSNAHIHLPNKVCLHSALAWPAAGEEALFPSTTY